MGWRLDGLEYLGGDPDRGRDTPGPAPEPVLVDPADVLDHGPLAFTAGVPMLACAALVDGAATAVTLLVVATLVAGIYYRMRSPLVPRGDIPRAPESMRELEVATEPDRWLPLRYLALAAFGVGATFFGEWAGAGGIAIVTLAPPIADLYVRGVQLHWERRHGARLLVRRLAGSPALVQRPRDPFRER